MPSNETICKVGPQFGKATGVSGWELSSVFCHQAVCPLALDHLCSHG